MVSIRWVVYLSQSKAVQHGSVAFCPGTGQQSHVQSENRGSQCRAESAQHLWKVSQLRDWPVSLLLGYWGFLLRVQAPLGRVMLLD